MREVLDLLVNLDHEAIRATGDVHWGPATAALVLVSASWVKGPFVVAVACCADLVNRRRYPLVALAATISDPGRSAPSPDATTAPAPRAMQAFPSA